MTKEEKYLQYLESFDVSSLDKKEVVEITLISYGEPKPYARPRFTRFGGKGKKARCYNKREKYMNDLKDEFKSYLTTDELTKINEAISSMDYTVEVEGKFFIKIPSNDSIKNRALKQLGYVRPTIARGDVDNYIKLILDVLHDVVYDDDKHVVKIISDKYYSDTPRIELKIILHYRKGDS